MLEAFSEYAFSWFIFFGIIATIYVIKEQVQLNKEGKLREKLREKIIGSQLVSLFDEGHRIALKYGIDLDIENHGQIPYESTVCEFIAIKARLIKDVSYLVTKAKHETGAPVEWEKLPEDARDWYKRAKDYLLQTKRVIQGG